MAPSAVVGLAPGIPKREASVVMRLASLQSTDYGSLHKSIVAHITTGRTTAITFEKYLCIVITLGACP
jgi:hypothetical protein